MHKESLHEEIWIDVIPDFDQLKLGRDSDILDLSYYEVNKRVIQRKTRKGNLVRIQRDDSSALRSGQCIYHRGDLFIQVNILPCLCVLLDCQNLSVVGEFCFDVGNRHLPVYLKADGRFAVSYDGRLYQALKEKYKGFITLENTILEPDEQITSIRRPILEWWNAGFSEKLRIFVAMKFGEELQAWYRQHKRDLPWRETKDAYKIWLSEIILQQTRVEQGLPYYVRFVERFKNVVEFANAEEDDILHLWQGLGYYSRGRNMHKAARIVRDQYQGVFPVDYQTLITLPGIGEYTAAAISSFANDEAQAVLDGNVFRVLARYYGIETPINSTEGKKIFTAIAKENLDRKHPALYNQAIMDFGATHCKPKLPLCEFCMFRPSCYALSQGQVEQLPVKLKAKASKDRYFNYFILKDNDRILMSKRGASDVWQNLYEFPLLESNYSLSIPDVLSDEWFISCFGPDAQLYVLQQQTKHILSHQNIYATFFEVRLKGDLIQKKSNWDYVFLKDLDKLAKHKLIFTFLERSNF